MTATTRDTTLEDVEVLSEAAATVDAAAAASTEGAQLPVIKVVKGSPTDVEVAALVAVFAAASSSGEAPVDTTPAEHWGDPVKMHRARAPFSPYSFQNRA
ncbi:acyl-CoA carboxylase subunit epsilon [Rhodococcus spelaei]|uniref:Acyl-CoA carboxylase subunit epsilon n=1 Tax=Rhodococcus spelaei TaxID=2546320 RepID=A0A541B138_9NOCA|nr:acyl-CoA carboxylase subunit epsilon [Rhodococcus spelaei]TQF66028.1 acyl-CoA carboxylase subunit epsilon [Rhodococcus spelaei]